MMGKTQDPKLSEEGPVPVIGPITEIVPEMPRIRELVADSGSSEVPAPPPTSDLSPRARAGLTLAKYMLGIIIAFLGITLSGMLLSEWRMAAMMEQVYQTVRPDATPTDSVQVTLLQQKVEALAPMMEAYRTDQAEARKFWMDVVQMILLGALLPVLTALLGYIFGTREAEAEG
jgi:hypothetical protein